VIGSELRIPLLREAIVDMEMRIVVMGDLVGSSSLREDDRRNLQLTLVAWLDDLQETLADSLSTQASITAGDAFQVVLASPEAVAAIAWAVWTAPAGINLRLGVGRGEIYTEFHADSRLMDGPAFHLARKAVSKDSSRIQFYGFGPDGDPILNGLAALLDAHLGGLTLKQRAVLELAREGIARKDIAEILGVTKQAVSRFIQASRWYQFERGELAFRRALALFSAENPQGSQAAE